MKRRFLFFGCGALISIFFLSMGPENRLKKTFFAYIDYFDMDKRVITHLVNDSTSFTTIAECQLVYYNLTKDDLLTVLNQGNVNFDLSDKDGDSCQYYVVENTINKNDLAVKFELCYYNNKSVRVMTFTANDDDEVCNF
jgi:hypothetical protein